MPASAAEQARAALALTRAECIDPKLAVGERAGHDTWRAGVLERVDLGGASGVSPTLKNRVAMQRASVWSAIAFRRARQGDAAPPAQAAAERARAEFARVVPAELGDDDHAAYNDSAMRVNATRWAALPAVTVPARSVAIRTVPGEPGQTCVELIDARRGDAVLLRRCTFAVVWTASATLNREGTALALAVQPGEQWRELWLFARQPGGGWTVDVLPPAATRPEAGYAEFAGWVPGGRQLLVAREARGEGKYRRAFELVRIDGLVVERQAGDPNALGAFQRWQDAAWKRDSVAGR